MSRFTFLTAAASLASLLIFLYFLLTRHFPWSLVALNLLLILTAAFSTRFWRWLSPTRLDLAFIGLLLLVLPSVYLYRLESITPGIWGDELTQAQAAQNLYQQPHFTPFHPGYAHPTPLLYFQGAILNTLGRSLTAIRLHSLIFAVASVIAFYALVRLHYSPPLSLAASLVFGFLYPFVVITRFGYDMTPAIFFQILCLALIFLIANKPDPQKLLALGLLIGSGLHTYLTFRTLAPAFLAIVAILLLRRRRLRLLLYSLAGIFIVAASLFAYAVSLPDIFWGRPASISVFHQNFTPTELTKELAGSTFRTFSMFGFIGDPNPRQNPGLRPVFDLSVVAFCFLGIIYTWRRHPLHALLLLSLFVPALLNDLLAVERIPEFHYYGLGHPNTYRVSATFPLVIFFVSAGLHAFSRLASKPRRQLALIFTPALLLSSLNLHAYFAQKPILWNHQVNGVTKLQVSSWIKQQNLSAVYLSPGFYHDPRVTYFLPADTTIHLFPLPNPDWSDQLPPQQYVIIDPQDDPDTVTAFVNSPHDPQHLSLKTLDNPFGGLDVLILYRLP